jgi:hypothetical protein
MIPRSFNFLSEAIDFVGEDRQADQAQQTQ